VIVIWIPTGAPGWMLEAATPYDARWIGGGIRTMYEMAAAIASTGAAVELRGAVSLPEFDAVCAAAGVRPDLPGEPRLPTADDTVIVPEGIVDPAVHARVVLSPARAVLLILGPPGLLGWPFTADWSPPDPLTVAVDAVARPEHFRAAAGLGYELWTHAPGIQRVAQAAGVPCICVGNGVPGGYPPPPRQKDVDVVWLGANRWGALARPVVRELSKHGIECVELGAGSHESVLEHFGRARVVLHPLRVEGHSRIGCEVRGMGAVPVVLDSNPFAVGLDEAGGALALKAPSDMPAAVLDLLADPERLASMSATALETARRQVEWEPFVSRVAAALDTPAGDPARGGRAAIGRALAEGEHEHGETSETEPPEAAGGERRRAGRAARRVLGAARPRPSPRRFFREPRGYLDWPLPGSEVERGPVNVLGWALFPGTSVARVEVSIAGGPPERARIALDRADLGGQTDHPDAPICAFEHKPDLSALAHDVRSVTIEVVAHALDGRRLALAPREFALVDPEPPFHDAGGRAEQLRRRSVEAISPGREPPSQAVRLLAFTHTLGFTGGSLYLYELLLRLARTPGFECRVVTAQDGPLRELFERAGMPVHVTDGNSVTSIERYEGNIEALAAWAASRGFNVAITNMIGGFPGADLAMRLGIPAIWTIHESWPLPAFWFAAYAPGALHPYVRERAEQALRDTSAVVFVADATRRLFVPHLDDERAVTVRYGIEHAAIDAALRDRDRDAVRRRLGIAPSTRLVLCLGSIEPRKAQALLAQAFAQVAGRHPDALLALVGATADDYSAGYRAALSEYVERAGLAPRVRIEPVTGEPFDWHLAADLLVCASDIESLPRSITEAMAFGTPVVSTRVFGVPELIEDGRSGWLCEARDLRELANALDRALGSSEKEREELTRVAREQVRARHDAERQADRMLTLIRGLAEDPGALPGDILAERPHAYAPRRRWDG
jgi:D-inositol-3-phosphate glycosyltransferase